MTELSPYADMVMQEPSAEVQDLCVYADVIVEDAHAHVPRPPKQTSLLTERYGDQDDVEVNFEVIEANPVASCVVDLSITGESC